MIKSHRLFLNKVSIALFWLGLCLLIIGFENFFAPFEGLNTELSYFNIWFPLYYALRDGALKGWFVIMCFVFGAADLFFPVKLKTKYRKYFRVFRAGLAFLVLLPYVCIFAMMINSIAPEH